ncbi:transglutaminase-like domain-containing protein [Sphingosinicella rhizophila]|uniref:Transglutaminase family protein n=1 Tax=Sphingosinicella rhizophila TaxID=3050082 RepID=A0ABU3Q4J4_9SPHN|nr:transglutaminase family protein [Sphingosinicella sp. GR2756]MDT9598227.1 transglutaminase family protein [Sphingosinicella sp. GR2756]
MRLSLEANLDYDFPEPADVLLAVEIAQMADQHLVEDRLTVTTATPLAPVEGLHGIGRRTWTRGEGRFLVHYRGIVDVDRRAPDLSGCAMIPLHDLPGDAIEYLLPSRYCRPDKFKSFAVELFGELEGGAKVTAMADWIRDNMRYVPGSSDERTTAEDSFLTREGICRDYAHVLIGFARALDIPARMVSAYAWKLEPPDFHAVVEVYLDDCWHLVDPTGLAPIEGLVRIGVGRDAADISFMTIFGSANLVSQRVQVERIGGSNPD